MRRSDQGLIGRHMAVTCVTCSLPAHHAHESQAARPRCAYRCLESRTGACTRALLTGSSCYSAALASLDSWRPMHAGRPDGPHSRQDSGRTPHQRHAMQVHIKKQATQPGQVQINVPDTQGMHPARALYTGAQSPGCAQVDSSTALAQDYMCARMRVLPIMSSMLTWVTNAPQAAALSRSAPSSCALRGRRPAERAAVRAQWIGGACGAQGADSHTPHGFNKARPASAQEVPSPAATLMQGAAGRRSGLQAQADAQRGLTLPGRCACRVRARRQQAPALPRTAGRAWQVGRPRVRGVWRWSGRHGRAPCSAAQARDQALHSCGPRVQLMR